MLLIANDPIGESMGGNAIRAAELSGALAPHADVTLAAPGEGTVEGTRRVRFDPADPAALRAPIDAADMIVSPPHGAVIARWLHAADATLIFDLYDPGPLEALENFAEATPLRRWAWNTLALDHTLGALHLGNRFLCASERQRDLWLGTMLGRRLITPGAYGRDPTLRSVIDVVPFGVSEQPPAASAAGGARARFPALGPESEIVLWNGGLWDWLDPARRCARSPSSPIGARRPGWCSWARRRRSQAPVAPRPRRGRSRATSVCSTGSCSSTMHGCRTRSGRAGSSRRTARSPRTATTSRRASRSARGCSTASGRGCRSSAPRATTSPGGSCPTTSARWRRPATAPRWPPALERVLGRGRASYGAALGRAADAYAWPVVAAPLVDFVVAGTHPPRLGSGWPSRASNPLAKLRGAAIRGGRLAAGTARRGAERLQ